MQIDGSHSQAYRPAQPNHDRGGPRGSRAEFAEKAKEVRSLQSAPSDRVAQTQSRSQPQPVRLGPLADSVRAVFQSYSFSQTPSASITRRAQAAAAESNSTAEAAANRPGRVRAADRIADSIVTAFRRLEFGGPDAAKAGNSPTAAENSSTAEAVANRPGSGRGADRIADSIVTALRRLDFGGPDAAQAGTSAASAEDSATAEAAAIRPGSGRGGDRIADAIVKALQRLDFGGPSGAQNNNLASAAAAQEVVPETAAAGPVSVSSEVLNSVADSVRGIRLDFRPGTEEVTLVTKASGSTAGDGDTAIMNAIADAIKGFQLSSSSGESAVNQIAAAVEALQLDAFQDDLDSVIVLGGQSSSDGEQVAGGFLAAVADSIRGLQVSNPNAAAPAVVAAKPQPTSTEPETTVAKPAEVVATETTEATTTVPDAVAAPQIADPSDITIAGTSLNQFTAAREALDLRSALVEALLGDGSDFLEAFSDRSFDFSFEISARYQSDTEEFEIGERFELKA